MKAYITATAIFLCDVSGFAQEFVVKPGRDTGVYAVGEKVTWFVEIKGDAGGLKDVRYRVKTGGVKMVKEDALAFTQGQASVEATMDQPGWLLLEVDAGTADGKKLNARGGAIVAPEKIKPAIPAPEDFEAFWAGKLRELAQVPANPVLTPGDSGNTNVLYDIIVLNNIRGTRVCGQIARPRRGDKLPAVLLLNAAGVGPSRKDRVVEMAGQGWLALNIETHDMPAAMPDAYYEKLWNGALKNYWTIGSEDRETCYFLRMYLACYRAAEYLATRADWDGKTLVATGPSQGGLQTIITAALHPKVTAALAMVPAGCDNNAAEAGRASGWPGWPMSTDGKDVAKVKQTGRYFDVVNFAPKVKCPILVGIGGIDTVCPPPGIYAAINQMNAPKEIIFTPGADHGNGHGRYYSRWCEWMAALRVGKTGFQQSKDIRKE